jgi:hypothetical protein
MAADAKSPPAVSASAGFQVLLILASSLFRLCHKDSPTRSSHDDGGDDDDGGESASRFKLPRFPADVNFLEVEIPVLLSNL